MAIGKYFSGSAQNLDYDEAAFKYLAVPAARDPQPSESRVGPDEASQEDEHDESSARERQQEPLLDIHSSRPAAGKRKKPSTNLDPPGSGAADASQASDRPAKRNKKP